MFQISSVIQNLRTLADKSWRLQIDTQELTPEEASQLMQLHGKAGWLLFAENPLTTDDVPKEPAVEFKGDKSNSERLRNCLFMYWKDKTSQSIDFNTFYTRWTDDKIQKIKDNL